MWPGAVRPRDAIELSTARGATPKKSTRSQATGARQAAIVGRLAIFGPAARRMSGSVHVRSFRGASNRNRNAVAATLAKPCVALGDQIMLACPIILAWR